MTRYLIFLSVFSIPFYHVSSIAGVRITTTELLFSTAFGVWIIGQFFTNNKLERTPLEMPIMLFLGACVLSSFGAYHKFIAFRETIQFAWLFGIYLLLFNFAKGKGIHDILFFAIVAGVITSAIGLYKCLSIPGDVWGYRASVASTFEQQPNALGGYLVGLIPLSFVYYIIGNKTWKYPAFLVTVIMLFALIATFSRGSWIGLALGMGMLIVIIRRYLLWKDLMILSLVGFSATGIILWGAGLRNFMEITKNAISHGSSDTLRVDLAKIAIDMTIKHPWMGVGQGNYGLLLPKELQFIEIPHNMFLQISAEMGLIGLAAFIWLLYAYYRTSFALLRKANDAKEQVIRAGLIGSATAVLASGLFGWPFSHGVQEILILSMALSTADWGTDKADAV